MINFEAVFPRNKPSYRNRTTLEKCVYVNPKSTCILYSTTGRVEHSSHAMNKIYTIMLDNCSKEATKQMMNILGS